MSVTEADPVTVILDMTFVHLDGLPVKVGSYLCLWIDKSEVEL